jgi:hypothetical protein
MRALAKKFFCSFALLALVRGSGTSFNEEVLEVEAELEKRATGNTTLKAPIIGVPSEDWYGLPSPIREARNTPLTRLQGRSRRQLVDLRNPRRHTTQRLPRPARHILARNMGDMEPPCWHL